jgi:hypothetical protein
MQLGHPRQDRTDSLARSSGGRGCGATRPTQKSNWVFKSELGLRTRPPVGRPVFRRIMTDADPVDLNQRTAMLT